MHDHDTALIMALAEGTLDASEVEAAQASIAACATCTRDLELQQQALAMLAAAPAVGMTEMESTRLRRALRNELAIAPAVTAAAVTSARRRRFNWAGALGAAAVLLVVVLAAPTLNLLGSSDDSSDATADLAFGPTTTVAASETTAAAGGSEQATSTDGEANEDAASLESEAAPFASGDVTTTLASEAPTERLQPTATLEEIALAYASSFATPNTADLYVGAPSVPETDEFDRCADTGTALLAEEGLFVEEWKLVGLKIVNGTESAVIAYQTAENGVIVLAHDAESCAVVGRA